MILTSLRWESGSAALRIIGSLGNGGSSSICSVDGVDAGTTEITMSYATIKGER
jgi:hypothetical protein